MIMHMVYQNTGDYVALLFAQQMILIVITARNIEIGHCIDCLLNCLLSHRLQKTSTPRVTGLCEGNPPVTGGFPSQSASIAGNVSIWWLHHEDEYEHNWSVQ